MSGLSYYEVLERDQEIPTLVVLGAGINQDGLTKQSILNAEVAAGLVMAELAPLDPVLTVGKSSTYVKVDENKSEAVDMAKIIEGICFPNGVLPFVLPEYKSYDTIQNLKNIGPHIEEYNLDAISIIAAIGHADRAELMAKRLFGKRLEVLPVYSKTDLHKLAQNREKFSYALYATLTAFSKPDTIRLKIGNKAYQTVMAAPKWVASKTPLSTTH